MPAESLPPLKSDYLLKKSSFQLVKFHQSLPPLCFRGRRQPCIIWRKAIFRGEILIPFEKAGSLIEMYMAGSFFKHVYLKKWIILMWPAVFEVYCQMAGRVQNKYQALIQFLAKPEPFCRYTVSKS